MLLRNCRKGTHDDGHLNGEGMQCKNIQRKSRRENEFYVKSSRKKGHGSECRLGSTKLGYERLQAAGRLHASEQSN